MNEPHKARILIAMNPTRYAAIVLTTDSDWVCNDIDAINAHVDDLGILSAEQWKDAEVGVYLWEGTLEQGFSDSFEGGTEPDGTEYDGTLRPIRGDELESLLTMSPPSDLALPEDAE